MSDSKVRRLTPKVLLHDIEVFEVLKSITGYTPVNADLSVANITIKKATKESSQEAESQAVATLKAKRDDAVEDEKVFHTFMLAAIDAIRAQFGEDSNEYQGLGRKKKSEHKSPKRKPKDGK